MTPDDLVFWANDSKDLDELRRRCWEAAARWSVERYERDALRERVMELERALWETNND